MKKENLKIKLMAVGGVVGIAILMFSGIKKITEASEDFIIQNENEKIENNNPQFRIMSGNYQDYKIIVTVDGNMWFTDEEYQEEELLQILFDTKGTKDIKDDEIIKIRSIDKRYMK